MKYAAAIVLGAALAAGSIGCSGKTEGQQTSEKAQKMESAGDMIQRGEMMMADSKAMKARAQELKNQGNDADGDRQMAEGNVKEKQAQALIDEGRKLRDQSK